MGKQTYEKMVPQDSQNRKNIRKILGNGSSDGFRFKGTYKNLMFEEEKSQR